MNYPLTEHEAMGKRQRTEDHGKVIFASVFRPILSVLWTIWNFSMISAEKVPGHDHLIFVITVEWISPVKHRVQKR